MPVKECSTSVLTGENLQGLLMVETWQMTVMGLRLPRGFAVQLVGVCHAFHPSSVQQTCSLRSVQNTCLSVVATARSFGLKFPAVIKRWISFGTTEQCLASLSVKCSTRKEVMKPKAPVHRRLPILEFLLNICIWDSRNRKGRP